VGATIIGMATINSIIIEIFTIDWCMDTSLNWIASINGTFIVIKTAIGSALVVYTTNSRVAMVIRAGIIVIADNNVMSAATLWVTAVRGAYIVVVTVSYGALAARIRIARVAIALVRGTTIDIVSDASLIGVTEFISTGIVIITIVISVFAASERTAEIGSAPISIIAGYF